jgi:hypothetical protein
MPSAWSKAAHGAPQSATGEAIARIASHQKQLIRLDQLVAIGVSPRGVRSRVERRRLFRIHRGVYALHPPPYSRRQRWLAATFACGPESALSDLCAAAHLEIWDHPTPTSHISNRSGAGRGIDGITVHRRSIETRDICSWNGIRTTTVPRTIIDCAHQVGLEGTEELIWTADSINRLEHRRLERLSHEHRGRPGVNHVLLLISDDPAELRSINERRMFRICRESGVPRPHTNHRIEVPGRHFFADFCWPELNLIVEADSWRWHGGRLATERDRERDQLLAIAGWRVVHFTRDQIKKQRAETGRRLVALLRRCAARTGRGS